MTKVFIFLILAGGLTSIAEARIKRDHKEIAAFKRENPCPSTGARRGACKGWIVDHVIPLVCGGQDAVSNMQWQTIEDGETRDKWE